MQERIVDQTGKDTRDVEHADFAREERKVLFESYLLGDYIAESVLYPLC
jgi:hypothetical protein